MNTATQQDRPTAADIVAELHTAAMPLYRRGATLYTREADGYRKLSPPRFLSWYETLTGKDAAHLSQAWAQQILASAAVQDYATELPALRLYPTADTTTEPAAPQEESAPRGSHSVIPVRPAATTGMTLMWPRLSAPATRTQYLHHTGGTAHPHSVEAAASIKGVAALTQADILPADGNQEPTAYQRAQAWLLDIQHHVIKDAACYPFEQRYFLFGTSLQNCVDLLFACHLAYPRATRFDYLTAERQKRQEQAKASHRAIYFCTTDEPEALREIIHQYNPYRPGQKYAEAQLLTENEFSHILEYYNIHTAPEHNTDPAARQNFYMTAHCDPRNTTHLPYDPDAASQYLHTTPEDNTYGCCFVILFFIVLALGITAFILLN